MFLEDKIYHCRDALRANGSADGKPLSPSIRQGETGEQDFWTIARERAAQSEVLADRMCLSTRHSLQERAI